jgi:hypothetical protein
MELKYPFTFKHATKIFIGLIIVELFFCAVYFTDFLLNEPNWRIHEWFNLDEEANIPSWFSTIQLFMIGLIAIATAQSEHYRRPPSKWGLTLFGLGFIYLSLDEGAALHEKFTYEFHNHPWVPYFDGVHGIWIVIYMGVAIVTLSILGRDLWAIFKTLRREALIFTVGMIIFLAGAGGSETITYFFIDKTNPMVYAIEVVLEEFLEMFGASILFYSVLLACIKKTEPQSPLT